MEAIRNRQGNVLRKVNPPSKCKNSAVERPVDELQKALRGRMDKLILSDSEDDEDSSDSDEWDD